MAVEGFEHPSRPARSSLSIDHSVARTVERYRVTKALALRNASVRLCSAGHAKAGERRQRGSDPRVADIRTDPKAPRFTPGSRPSRGGLPRQSSRRNARCTAERVDL
jgi:hypothetical protein